MRSRGTRQAALIAAAALVIAGCTGGLPVLSSGPPPTPSATAVPVASPTAAASPSAQPSASAVTALPEGGQTVFPGTYTTHFQPALTLTVGSEVELSCVAGYECRGDVDVNMPGFIFFEFGNAPAFEVGLVRVDKVFDPKHPGKMIDPPEDLVTWITKLPGLTVLSPPVAVKVGGLDAMQLEISVGAKDVNLGPIPGVTDPGAGFPARHTNRVFVVRVQGHQVLISIDANEPGDAHFHAAVDELQPLIDSIVWR